MGTRRQLRGVIALALRFMLFAPPCLGVWWLVLPAYAYFLGFVASVLLKYVINVPVASFRVFNTGILSDHGFLNTGTQIAFVVKGTPHEYDKLAYLTTNVAPFVALVLSTPGLGLRRRGKVIALGVAILVATHVAFIIIAYTMGRSEVSTAVGETFITLPLLLWIVLAYWEHLASYFTDVAAPKSKRPDK